MKNPTAPDYCNDEWVLALDLLIARAALDQELRTLLLDDPLHACKVHGVAIPDGIQLIITTADLPSVIRQIPTALPNASFAKTGDSPRLREPVVYNGSTEYTETNTTTAAEAELTEAEVQTTTTTTTAEAEAEVVVVLT
jgi:hypothetical protein